VTRARLKFVISLGGLAQKPLDPKHFFWFLPTLLLSVLLATNAEGRFTSRFSLSVTEEYNDNIFFAKKKDPDFVTSISPTLTLFYQPLSQNTPIFNTVFTFPAKIFARNSQQNSYFLSKNQSLNTDYTYQYSPRLTVDFRESLRLFGSTRTADSDISDLIIGGDQLNNNFSINGKFLFKPKLTFFADFKTNYRVFLDAGGSETSNSIGARGSYVWKQHNIHLGYGITVLKSRSGEDNVVHSIDVGDDFFSKKTIKLTPTLTLLASSGISLNTGTAGPRLANNTDVSLTKVWQGASLSARLTRGLSSSLGVSGISETTNLSSNFNIRLTQFLTLTQDVNMSFFETEDNSFNIFQAKANIQYFITPWMAANLSFTHRSRDTGKVASNSVNLSMTLFFDIWPNTALGRGLQSRPPVATVSP